MNTVPTQCIAVDSPSHTYLCTRNLIPTHNTNSKLEMKSYYDRNKKSNVMMKYPLNNVMDCNGMHYALQLSLYAWMIKQIKPEYEVKRLTLH